MEDQTVTLLAIFFCNSYFFFLTSSLKNVHFVIN